MGEACLKNNICLIGAVGGLIEVEIKIMTVRIYLSSVNSVVLLASVCS